MYLLGNEKDTVVSQVNTFYLSGRILISTRRLQARPSVVVLAQIGKRSPLPRAMARPEATP